FGVEADAPHRNPVMVGRRQKAVNPRDSAATCVEAALSRAYRTWFHYESTRATDMASHAGAAPTVLVGGIVTKSWHRTYLARLIADVDLGFAFVFDLVLLWLSATAARIKSFKALSLIFSPSWMSMARLTLPSRLELKSPEGSCKE